MAFLVVIPCRKPFGKTKGNRNGLPEGLRKSLQKGLQRRLQERFSNEPEGGSAMMHWYTADTHFGHENIIKHCARPFHSANHMDAVLIENLTSKVGPDDALWIVGDFAFGPKAKNREWLRKLFERLPGAEKHLVIGNHDGEATQRLPWTSVVQLAEVADGSGPSSVLCHYPMITWHRARKGALHLFGHVHEQWMGSRNAVNVGVDVWGYVPVTLREAQQRAATLPINAHWSNVERNAEI